MGGSLLIVAFFIIGCVVGRLGLLPEWLVGGDVAMWLLYALMIQVGMSIGSDSQLKSILRSLSPRMLALPLGTIVGTLVAVALVSLLIPRWGLTEVMAAGSGMGYYSLSSILVTTLKEPMLGAEVAAELGAITLIVNILRELMTLVLAPLMVRWFSPLAPIASGGATTMDVTLPIITQASGREWVFMSIVHGIMVDLSVPILVPLLCSL